jgi:hypothetical protein
MWSRISKAPRRKPVWHDDVELMKWLASLSLALGLSHMTAAGLALRRRLHACSA